MLVQGILADVDHIVHEIESVADPQQLHHSLKLPLPVHGQGGLHPWEERHFQVSL